MGVWLYRDASREGKGGRGGTVETSAYRSCDSRWIGSDDPEGLPAWLIETYGPQPVRHVV